MTVLLISGAVSCQQPRVSEPVEETKERELIAWVNGHSVFRSDFEEYLGLTDETRDDEAVGSRFQHFLVQLILFHEAEREGYLVPAELSRKRSSEWEAIGETNSEPGTRNPELGTRNSELSQEWNRRFLTVQSYIRSRLDEGSQVSLKQLRWYYTEHEEEFLVNEQLRVLEILVKEPELAGHVHSLLEPGDFRTFRGLARKHSVGTHENGELGVFEPGQLPPVFEKLIFGLKIGEISPVFSSQFGYHVFTVEERTPKHYQKFYEVQEQIFELLVTQKERQAIQAFVQARITKAEVEILDEQLEGFWRNRNAGLG